MKTEKLAIELATEALCEDLLDLKNEANGAKDRLVLEQVRIIILHTCTLKARNAKLLDALEGVLSRVNKSTDEVHMYALLESGSTVIGSINAAIAFSREGES